MYEDLTEKQKQILEFIKKQTRECGYPPSVREICEAVGFKSTSSVHSHLKTLEQRSYIRRTSLKTRAIDVINKDDDDGLENFQTDREMVTLPLLGKITAGDPILAAEDIMDQVPLPLSFVGTGEHFLLRVKGTSMINAGILDGDDIIVKKQNTVYRDQDIVILKPQNPNFEPRELKDTEVQILGRVTGLLRKM